MDIRQIDKNYTVSGQIIPAHVAEIAKAGFKTIICHRPDGEAGDQPSHLEIRKAATEHGLEFRYIPVVSGQMTAEDVAKMSRTLDDVVGPIFAYCRSGARSTNIYAAASQQR